MRENAGHSFSELWADVDPRRDYGMALVGRCVRCCLPKGALKLATLPSSMRVIKRMLEVKVVSLVDYAAQLQTHHANRQLSEQGLKSTQEGSSEFEMGDSEGECRSSGPTSVAVDIAAREANPSDDVEQLIAGKQEDDDDIGGR